MYFCIKKIGVKRNYSRLNILDEKAAEFIGEKIEPFVPLAYEGGLYVGNIFKKINK